MRQIININKDWVFTKPETAPENVNITHSWNAIDGQDGGADYFRGTCKYTKTIAAGTATANAAAIIL